MYALENFQFNWISLFFSWLLQGITEQSAWIWVIITGYLNFKHFSIEHKLMKCFMNWKKKQNRCWFIVCEGATNPENSIKQKRCWHKHFLRILGTDCNHIEFIVQFCERFVSGAYQLSQKIEWIFFFRISIQFMGRCVIFGHSNCSNSSIGS